MRTFITSLLLALSLPLWSQSTAPDTSITYVGTVIPYDPPLSDDYMARCYNAWHGIKPYASPDTVEKYAPFLVQAHQGDVELAYYAFAALVADEDQGTVTNISDGGHGHCNIHREFKYKEYMENGPKMPGFIPFEFDELDKPENIRYTLAVINYQFWPGNIDGFTSNFERFVAWNVGKAGMTDPKKKKRREDYGERFLLFLEKGLTYLGQHGILHWA